MYPSIHSLDKGIPVSSSLLLILTLSVIAALRMPMDSNTVDFPDPFAPIRTLILPGSNSVSYIDLKYLTCILSIFMLNPFQGIFRLITGLNDIKTLLTANVGCDLVHQYQASFGEVEKTLD